VPYAKAERLDIISVRACFRAEADRLAELALNPSASVPSPRQERIPTLDGWRGIAILLVLFDHIEHAAQGHYAHPWMQTGEHGVTIFFVLSGYLITARLLDGPIDLQRFFIRRFFRLMPVAWTYLAVLLLLSCLVHIPFTSIPEVEACVFFYRNFAEPPGLAAAGHFWSLSLEEQFYLVWPCVLLLAGAKKCRWIAAAGAIVCASARWMYWARYGQDYSSTQSHLRADSLLIGCLMALLLQSPRIRSAATRWSRLWALPAAAFLLFCMARFHVMAPLSESIAIAALIAAASLNYDSIFARPLSNRFLTQLGVISYSIYVWQEIFMFHWGNPGAAVLLCACLPLVVIASYTYIERPFTRIGHELTSGTREKQILRIPQPLEAQTE
jgi:peptidoglycan/LPS O-acetylase OafA/YrhL